MLIAVAADHAGVPLRETVLAAVREAGHEPVDFGEHDDYPQVALRVGRSVVEGETERGILICGSGAGVAVAACKIAGIRAATCHDHYTAGQCVSHDDCNVLCLGARVIGPAVAAELTEAFCNAHFSGGARHVRRVHAVLTIEQEGLEAEL